MPDQVHVGLTTYDAKDPDGPRFEVINPGYRVAATDCGGVGSVRQTGGMAGTDRWTPELRVHETGAGCRLVLVGMTYGNGETLQEAADDLVARLLNLTLCMRGSGFRLSFEAGRPDPRALELLWELGDMASRGEDIRERIFGHTEASDATG